MSESNRIPYLDGLRGISIIMVLLGHGAHSFTHSDIVSFIGNSHLGVMVFFNISGFLITTLLLKEFSKKGHISIKDFYIRRALRIFPVFYTYVLLISILVALNYLIIDKRDIIFAAANLWNYKTVFVSTTTIASELWYLGHFWTLALEEQFYLFWPLIIMIVRHDKIIKYLPYVLFFFPISRILTYYLFPDLRGQIGMMFHTMSDSLLWGGYASLLIYYHKDKVMAVIHKYVNGFVVICALLFIFVGSVYLSRIFKGSYTVTIGFTLESITISFLIMCMIVSSSKKLDFLNNTYLVYIGTLSYSLYIWQQLYLARFPSSIVFAFPLNYILCFATAIVSYYTVEKAGLSIKKKFFS